MKKSVYSVGLLVVMLLLSTLTQAQNIKYVKTVPPLNGGNGSAGISFNVGANKRVTVEEIHVSTYANTTVNVWMNTDSINGSPTINTANGWTQIATGVSVPGGGAAGNVQLIPTAFNVTIPAGKAYGFYIEPTSGGVHYTTGSGAQADVYTDGTLHINTGSNVGYGGGAPSPTFHIRRFNGWIGYSSGIPCVDTPLSISKVLAPNYVCPNKRFYLRLDPVLTGLSYKWQYSYNNGASWSNFTGSPDTSNGGQIFDSITVDKWYRCIITCNGDNKTYTTSAHKVAIAPFYYCYCDNKVTNDGGADIGNLKVINMTSGDTVVSTVPLSTGIVSPLYNNKDANKVYSSYHDSLAWPCLYRDTTYKFIITQAHTSSSLTSTVAHVYIDLNRDGVYNPNSERVAIKAIDGTGNPPEVAEIDYKIPGSASIGYTGMRVIVSEDTIKVAPCDTLTGEGEVEDYIVEICHRPCDGPLNAGVVVSTDTSMCNSYEYTLTDTTYQKNRSQFTWDWQISGDDISWFNIANSTKKDTLQRVFTGQPLYYRVRMVCPGTQDTTYTSSTKINVKPGYKCYCYSKAIGGASDTSDIGGITIAGISTYNGGPHLLNAQAVRPRTDHTDDNPTNIYVDSLYSFYVYHTMNVKEHGDSKVTIFMDFDNDHEYDVPAERIYTGFTSIGNYTLIDNIQIPKTAITDVPTGLRVILNNDVGPNIPSDEACGGYVSGETEDFMVIFRNKVPDDINNIAKLTGFGIYPNPNNGQFSIQFNTDAAIDDLQLRITNVTGQLIYQDSYKPQSGVFSKEIDLTGKPTGVYIVEIQADGQKLIRRLVIK